MALTTKSETELASGAVFDSYAYVRRLRDAGMDEELAAIQAEQFAAVIETRLASKRDLLETEARLRVAIAAIDAKLEATKAGLQKEIETCKISLQKEAETNKNELKRDMKEMELRMIIKMGAMILASVGMIIGFMRAFPTPVQLVNMPQEVRSPTPIPATPVPPANGR
ncbi:MAG: hypothetical protein HQM04_10505 [Magnetococcales bacterium]|nr:hypothetical protein [Magnetococcales bacterium]MBF0115458.1 hypothetical protein [Magnetococcales bacterium]